MINLKTSAGLFLASFLVLSFAFPYAHGQSATGTATITATCGISLSTSTFAFGSIASGATSGTDAVQIDFTNGGSVTSSVTVNGKDWKDGSDIVHINGELTKFATTNQGTSGAGVVYASKSALNSTDGDVAFGVVKTSPSTNQTYWQLQATLQNLPFSGSLTQAITFTGSCLG